MKSPRPRPRPAALLAALGALCAAGGAEAEPTVETSFEFADDSGAFTVGTSPFTVTFEGGFAGDVDRPDLVYDGESSWLVPVGESAEIAFGFPAEQVRFYTRKEPGMGALITGYRYNGRTNTTSLGSTFHLIQEPLSPILGALERVTVGPPTGDPGEFVAIDLFLYRAHCGQGVELAVQGEQDMGDVVLCLIGRAGL